MTDYECFELVALSEGLVKHGPTNYPDLDQAIEALLVLSRKYKLHAVRITTIIRRPYLEWGHYEPR